MCGICGFNWNDGELVRRMTDQMTHRGPDQSNVHASESISLGHRRLSIIDLSELGRQPMANEDGSVRLVFNGEIYNFRELRDELVAKGHRFTSQTDSEVIVHAYEEYGIDAIGKGGGGVTSRQSTLRRRRGHVSTVDIGLARGAESG